VSPCASYKFSNILQNDKFTYRNHMWIIHTFSIKNHWSLVSTIQVIVMMLISLSVTYGREMVFSVYSSFLNQ
jgi:hypothetical protein